MRGRIQVILNGTLRGVFARATVAIAVIIATASSALAAVEGVVINATTGKPQASAIVSVVQPGASGMQTLASVKSGADGKFSIETRLPPGPTIVQGAYQGVIYNLVLTPGTPTTGLLLNVYDATTNPASGKVAQHIMVIEPTANALQITETFVARNDTKETYLDAAKGSIQFYVPEAARDKVQVTIAAPGGMPITRPAEPTKKPGVYKASYPLKPGETHFDVSYSLPPGDSFSGRNPDPSTPINLVTPSAVTLSGDGVESKGQEPRTQAHIYAVSAPTFDLKIEGTGSLRASDNGAAQEDDGHPEVRVEPSRIYGKLDWVLGLTLAILALGGVALYRKGAA
jgi:hypothetical protein